MKNERQTRVAPCNRIKLYQNMEFRLGHICIGRQETSCAGKPEGRRDIYFMLDLLGYCR